MTTRAPAVLCLKVRYFKPTFLTKSSPDHAMVTDYV